MNSCQKTLFSSFDYKARVFNVLLCLALRDELKCPSLGKHHIQSLNMQLRVITPLGIYHLILLMTGSYRPSRRLEVEYFKAFKPKETDLPEVYFEKSV